MGKNKRKSSDFKEALSQSGNIGQLIAGTDWSKTSLGTFENWPEEVKLYIGEIIEHVDQSLPEYEEKTGRFVKENHNKPKRIKSQEAADANNSSHNPILDIWLAKKEEEQEELSISAEISQIANSNIVGVLIGKPNGKIIYANDYFLKVTGYSRQDFEDNLVRWDEITPQQFHAQDQNALDQSRSKRTVVPYEKQYIRKDGSLAWVLISDVYVDDLDESIFSFLVDISEKKQMEQATANDEINFSKVFHCSPGFMFIIDANRDTILEVNQNFCNITGYDRQELKGKNIFESGIFGPGIDKDFFSGISADGSSKNVEISLSTKSKSQLDTIFSVEIIEYAKKRHYLVAGIDNTEGKKIKEELQTAKNKLQITIDSMTDGLLSLDKNWYIREFNSLGSKIFGMDKEDLIGKCIWDLFPQLEDSLFFTEYHKAAESGEPVHFEEFYPEPLNSWLEVHCYPEDEGLTVYFSNISDRKNAENALRENEQQQRFLLENLPDVMIAKLDRNLRYTFISKSIEKITGKPNEHFIGKKPSETIWQDRGEAESAELKMQQVFDTGRETSIQYTIEVNNQTRHRKARIYPDESDKQNGKAEFITLFSYDVTELIEAEQELLQKTAQLEATINSIPEGYILYDNQGYITRLNAIAVEILGFDEEENNLSYEERIGLLQVETEDGKPFPIDQIPSNRAQLGEKVQGVVMKINRYEKSYWLSVSAAPIISSDGKKLGVVMEFTDITANKNAEFKLQQSESQFRLLAESLPQLVWFTDASGQVEYFNQRWQEFTGLEPHNSLGARWAELLHPDDYQRTLDIWTKSVETGEPYYNEYRFRRASDGSYCWFIARALPIYNEKGEITRWFGTSTDIQPQKEAQAAIKKSERRLIDVLESMPDAFVNFDHQMRYTYLNGNAERLQNAKREDLLGKDVRDIYPDPESRKSISRYEKVLHEQKPDNFIFYHGGFDGWYEVRAFPNIEGVSVFFKDVSEQVKSEIALRKSEERYQLVNQATHDIIWDWDILQKELHWNDAIEMAVRKNGQATTIPDINNWRDYIHPDDRDRVLVSIRQAIKSGENTWSSEYRFGPVDGPYRTYFDRGLIARDENGKAYRMVGSMLDLSQQKEAENLIKDKEQRLRLAAEAAKLGVFEWQIATDHVTWENRRMFDVYGLTPDDETINKARFIREVILEEDLGRFINDLEREMHPGGILNGQYRIKRFGDGEIRWIEFYGQFNQYSENDGLRLIGVLEDVTENKLAEQEKEKLMAQINAERQRLEAILQQLPVGLIIGNLTGQIVYINDYARKLFGPDFPREGYTRHLKKWQIYHSDGRRFELEENPMYRALKGKSTVDQELHFQLNHNKEWVFAQFSGLPIYDDQGLVEEGVVSILDITQRKLDEQERERLLNENLNQRNFLETLLNSAMASIAVMQGPELRYTLVNKSYQALRPEVQMTGLRFRDVFPEAVKTGSEKTVLQVLESGQPHEEHGYSIPIPGKEDAAWDTQIIRLPLTENETPSVLVITWDTTEHKRLQKQLKRREEDFRTLANNISQLAWMMHEDGDIFWYNQRWFDYTGTGFDAMKSWGWQKVHHPDHLGRVMVKIKEALRQGIPWEDTFPLLGKDGNYRWFLSRAIPIRDELGKIVRWFGTNTDITDLKNAQEKLLYQNSLLEAQQEVSPLGVLVVSPEGKVLTYNNKFVEMWELEEESMPSEDDQLMQEVEKLLEDSQKLVETAHHCYRNRLKNHDKVYFKNGKILERFGSPVIDYDGTNYGYVWFFMDISEQEYLTRQKDDFLGIASHELKTPVTVMKGYIRIIRDLLEQKGNDTEVGLLSNVDRQIVRLTNLINDLLDVTKIEAGKMQFSLEKYDFDQLVEDTVESMQKITNHKLIIEGSADKTISGDRDRTGQVIINLLSNAIKYSKDEDEILIKVGSDNQEVNLQVVDYGTGIAPTELPKIFDRFYQVRKTKGNSSAGLGLGLYICYEIIKRQGGRMSVESQTGSGSTFGFSLPL